MKICPLKKLIKLVSWKTAEFPVCLAIESKPRVVHEVFALTLSLRSIEGEMHQVDIRNEQMEDPEASILIQFFENGELS